MRFLSERITTGLNYHGTLVHRTKQCSHNIREMFSLFTGFVMMENYATSNPKQGKRPYISMDFFKNITGV